MSTLPISCVVLKFECDVFPPLVWRRCCCLVDRGTLGRWSPAEGTYGSGQAWGFTVQPYFSSQLCLLSWGNAANNAQDPVDGEKRNPSALKFLLVGNLVTAKTETANTRDTGTQSTKTIHPTTNHRSKVLRKQNKAKQNNRVSLLTVLSVLELAL